MNEICIPSNSKSGLTNQMLFLRTQHYSNKFPMIRRTYNPFVTLETLLKLDTLLESLFKKSSTLDFSKSNGEYPIVHGRNVLTDLVDLANYLTDQTIPRMKQFRNCLFCISQLLVISVRLKSTCKAFVICNSKGCKYHINIQHVVYLGIRMH